MTWDPTETHDGPENVDDEELPAPPPHTDGEPDDATTSGGGPSLIRAAGVLRSWRLAWGVAVVSLLVALGSLGWVATLYAQERRAEAELERIEAEQERAEAARERGERIVEQVTTFRGADIDQWVADTQALATGDYAEQVAGLFDDEFREALRENEVESEGEIDRAYLQQLEDDTAEVFVVARQTSTNVLRDEPVEDQLRMDLTLRYEDGEWLASDIEVLGPAPSGFGDPALDETPDEDDD